jgi:hypothetical protein
MIRLIQILFVVMLCMALSGYGQTSGGNIEAIGLYSLELEAIRTIVTPAKITLNSQDESDFRVLKDAFEKISSGGQELLLAAENAIVIVDAKGKWRYRSSSIATLQSRSFYRLSDEDLKNVKAFLANRLYKIMRDHIVTNVLKGKAKSEAVGNTLAEAKRELKKADFEWFQSFVGDEINALDSESRKALLQDKVYGDEFQKAVDAADAIKNQRLSALSTVISKGTGRQINLRDIKFALSEIGTEATASGSTQLNTMGNRKVLTLSGSGTSIFVTPKTENSDLPAELTPEKLIELLGRDMIKIYIASGPTSNIIAEVKKTPSP